MADPAYLFNRSTFAFEIFADEIVVLNLTEGSYFALGGWVMDIWPGLANRQPLGGLAEAAAARYGASAAVLRDELDTFVARLVEERILVAAEPEAGAVILAEVGSAGALQPLAFEKHVDMQDLMTLDPIHDVDPEQGWPHRPPKP